MNIRLFIALCSMYLLSSWRIWATSDQPYKQYLTQYDSYRTQYNDFSIAKQEYIKFKTLTSQQTALDKTKNMLSSRDMLLKSYLLFLSDKLNENKGLSDETRQAYKAPITDEISFLDSQYQLIGNLETLTDAETLSKNQEQRDPNLQLTIYKSILTISLGNLRSFITDFDTITKSFTAYINENREVIPEVKQRIVDQWLISIQNKRSSYQDKIDKIDTEIKSFTDKTGTIDKKSDVLLKDINTAKNDIVDAVSYMKELLRILKYSN